MIDKIKILASRTGFWVFLFALALCLTVRSGHIYTPDEEILFRTAESFSNFSGGAIEPLGGYARVRNARGEFVTVYQQGFGTRRGSGDLEYAQYGIGQPLLAVPLVWLGKAILPILPASATETLQVQGIQYHDGSLRSYQLRHAVSHFNCLITALAAYCIFFLTSRLFGNRKAAVAVALIYAVATMALPHSKTFLSEPLAGLCALASLAFAVKGFRSSEGDSPSASNAVVRILFRLCGADPVGQPDVRSRSGALFVLESLEPAREELARLHRAAGALGLARGRVSGADPSA
jgi:hypothetical protein